MLTITPEQVIKAEVQFVQKIIQDETWYEGERRNSPVSEDDTTVIQKVTEICSVCGAIIWHDAEEKLKKEIGEQ